MILDSRYAHSLPDRPREEWQELRAHLENVAAIAAQFAAAFDSADWAHNAAWLHDIGKNTRTDPNVPAVRVAPHAGAWIET